MTTVAVSLCKKVNLYGFWPFTKDLEGNQVPYHYYDDIKLGNASFATHAFSEEFRTLLQLHEDGIVNLQVHPCETVT